MRILVFCFSNIFLLATSLTLRAQSDPDDCYQKFNNSLQGVKSALADRYGNAWHIESLPSEISGELTLLQSADTKLKVKLQDLTSQRSGLNWDENSLETKTKAFEARNDSLAERHRQLDEEERELRRENADLEGRIALNGPGCFYREGHPEECAAYERERIKLQAEQDEIKRRVKSVEQRQDNSEEQRQQLESEASGLAELRTTLAQRNESLTNDESSFLASCEDTTARARALTEAISANISSARGEERDRSAGILKSLGQDVVVKAFEYVAQDARYGPYAGVALSAADFMHTDMDSRTKEITNNIYLLGDYAAGLRRLKEEGRLHPGDPGYDALQIMTRRLGEGMPTSGTTFTLESLSNTRVLVETAVASLASHYGAKKSEHVTNEMFRHLTSEEKQVLGKNGVKFFHGATSVVMGASASTTPAAFFKDSAEVISQHRARLAEKELQH